MFEIIMFIGCIFAIVAVISYLKNLDPELRKEQIKTVTDSGLVATGFAATALVWSAGMLYVLVESWLQLNRIF